jgi:hypothetical protein
MYVEMYMFVFTKTFLYKLKRSVYFKGHFPSFKMLLKWRRKEAEQSESLPSMPKYLFRARSATRAQRLNLEQSPLTAAGKNLSLCNVWPTGIKFSLDVV